MDISCSNVDTNCKWLCEMIYVHDTVFNIKSKLVLVREGIYTLMIFEEKINKHGWKHRYFVVYGGSSDPSCYHTVVKLFRHYARTLTVADMNWPWVNHGSPGQQYSDKMYGKLKWLSDSHSGKYWIFETSSG